MISVSALVLFVGTFLIVFGWRSAIQFRRTGDTGWRSPSRAVDPAQWWSRIVMAAGTLALAAAPILDMTDVVPLLPVVDNQAVRLAGLLVAMVSAAAILAAQLGMGASWRIGVDAEERTGLVTSGAFAWVRNPIFTAMIAFTAGLTFAVPNLAAIAALILVVAGIQWQVRSIEEPYLRSAHGQAYADYTRRVGRFLPKIGVQ